MNLFAYHLRQCASDSKRNSLVAWRRQRTWLIIVDLVRLLRFTLRGRSFVKESECINNFPSRHVLLNLIVFVVDFGLEILKGYSRLLLRIFTQQMLQSIMLYLQVVKMLVAD